MTTERLPLRKCLSRGLNCSINICRRSLGDGSNLFSCRWIHGIKKDAFNRLPPCSIDEVSEPSSVAVQPDQCFFWVLRRRPVLHGDEFFSNAHFSGMPMVNKLKRSDDDNLPSIFHSHGVPAVAQYRRAIRLPRSEKVLSSSKVCRVPLSSATTTPTIVS